MKELFKKILWKMGLVTKSSHIALSIEVLKYNDLYKKAESDLVSVRDRYKELDHIFIDIGRVTRARGNTRLLLDSIACRKSQVSIIVLVINNYECNRMSKLFTQMHTNYVGALPKFVSVSNYSSLRETLVIHRDSPIMIDPSVLSTWKVKLGDDE